MEDNVPNQKGSLGKRAREDRQDSSDEKEMPREKLETPDPSEDEGSDAEFLPEASPPSKKRSKKASKKSDKKLSKRQKRRRAQVGSSPPSERAAPGTKNEPTFAELAALEYQRKVLHAKFVKRRKATIKPVSFRWSADFFNAQGERVGTVLFGGLKVKTLEDSFREDPEGFDYTFPIPESRNPEGLTAVYTRKVFIAGREVTLPDNWKLCQSHTCQLYTLDREGQEFLDLEERFLETLPTAKITSIQRIQNLLTYQKYYAELLRIASECEDPTDSKDSTDPKDPRVSWRFLFHGTKQLPPAVIISSQEGFDARLSSETTLWGPGAYFADDASYSNKYAFRTSQTSRQMLVASVATGSSFPFGNLVCPTLSEPPLDIPNRARHHSINGITNDSRVYVVYNSNQCCPRYLIKYEMPPSVPVAPGMTPASAPAASTQVAPPAAPTGPSPSPAILNRAIPMQ